tara:strand:- start:37687 stop:39480 length:1794 start_codon:yes stop_codon:yes gene_type:complete
MHTTHQGPRPQAPRPHNPDRPNRISRGFIWLSGASAESLQQCPHWERRKYVAFGAAVLVPCLFALIACSYAISTLTPDWRIIVPISIVWAFIILTIDRALLATYRCFQSKSKKATQFTVRIVVALLMGLTVSHPLTLLLFKDTIVATIEEERDQEIEGVRGTFRSNKGILESKIATVESEISSQRADWKDTFDAKFIVADEKVGDAGPAMGLTPEERTNMESQIEGETARLRSRIAELDEQLPALTADYRKLQTELDHWQREFEKEINGQRSGIVGVGPRARSIRDDQLEWRRAEAKRLSGLMQSLTKDRTQTQQQIASTQERIKSEFNGAATARVRKAENERLRVAALRSQVQEQQAAIFVNQQTGVREQIEAQINSGLTELARLRTDLSGIAEEEKTRIDAIREEPRRDLLTQTLALHGLFENGAEGGHFALMAYLVLAGLFMLVDTIPLIVKFFSKPGPYDEILAYDEYHYNLARLGVEGPISRLSTTVNQAEFSPALFRPDTSLMTAFHDSTIAPTAEDDSEAEIDDSELVAMEPETDPAPEFEDESFLPGQFGAFLNSNQKTNGSVAQSGVINGSKRHSRTEVPVIHPNGRE